MFLSTASLTEQPTAIELGPAITGDPFRVAFFNILYTLRSTANMDAQKRHFDRVDADILGLSEIQSSDETWLNAYASGAGYQPPIYAPYIHNGVKTAVMSKYPIEYYEFPGSPPGADEFIRLPTYLEVDVDGMRLAVTTIHAETLCQSGPCDFGRPQRKLELARAVEWIRMAQHIAGRLNDRPDMRYVVMGDHNDSHLFKSVQTASFDLQPEGHHSWYELGSDITLPLDYSLYPFRQASAAGLNVLDLTNTDGSRFTTWPDNPNPVFTEPKAIDYISHSTGLTMIGSEILDSEVSDQTAGITKYGSPLAFGDSRLASDHKMIFADLAQVG